MFNRSQPLPAAEEDDHDLENPLLHEAAEEDDHDLENPLLHEAAEEDDHDLENPLLHAAAEENDHPLLQSASNVEADVAGVDHTPSPRRRDWLVIALAFLTIFGVVIYYFVKDVNHVYGDPGFELQSVAVSSFNVSRTFPKTRWDTELALVRPEGDFSDLDVRYESPRLRLYSPDEGFASSTSPSIEYSPDGKKLVLRAMFVVGKNVEDEDEVVKLDLLMESNALSRSKTHSIKSFLMIDCRGLKIEFGGAGKRFGSLVSGGKSCGVEVWPMESHPLYDGADTCTTSTKLRFRNLSI